MCTFVICKARILKLARKRDPIVDFGPLYDPVLHEHHCQMVYIMKVGCIKTIREYDEYARVHLSYKIIIVKYP
jgi:hypothetical protein